eukprot:3295288-Prymnesium_polylepis.1
MSSRVSERCCVCVRESLRSAQGMRSVRCRRMCCGRIQPLASHPRVLAALVVVGGERPIVDGTRVGAAHVDGGTRARLVRRERGVIRGRAAVGAAAEDARGVLAHGKRAVVERMAIGAALRRCRGRGWR